MADVRRLTAAALDDTSAVINAAAERYRGVIPAEADTRPYMPKAELRDELAAMTFYGVDRDGLAGVIGIQERGDVTLVRHLYVRPAVQRQGLGSELLEFGLGQAESETILVGTWAAADWAIGFYRKHGFELLGADERRLATYWDVPDPQLEASVVLRYDRRR